ncbi:hypothetical protein BDZ97DRAFT_1665051, partial [Flammula alnicola]
IVSEVTTLRRHIEWKHRPLYDKWCERNDFESKLPKAQKAADREKQSSLDPHLEERQPRERTIPYSDALFREAAVEWLVSTDQPIQAFEHPSFKKMIDIAARATHGVTLPNRKATRKHIIQLFKKNLTGLRERLKVH